MQRINLSQEQSQEIVQAYIKGDSLATTSKRFGLCRKVITRVINDAGIVPKHDKLSDTQKQAVFDAYTKQQVKSIQLAKQYGVSQGTIENVLKAFGLDLTRKHLKPEQEQRIIYSYNVEGKTCSEVAQEVGFSNVTVCNVLAKAGIQARGSNKFSTEEEARIVADYKGGESSESIAKRLGVVGSCITGIIRRNGEKMREQRLSKETQQAALNQYLGGKFVKDIANDLSVDKKTITLLVKTKGHKLRLERGKLPTLKDRVIALYQSGKTCEEVAKELGLTGSNVNIYLKKRGLSRPPAIANPNRAMARLKKIGDERCYKERRKFLQKVRTLYPYQEWRKVVLQRDSHTCQWCGATENIQADHVYPFVAILHEYKITTLEQAVNCELLWRTDNGRTLCKSCHIKTDTYGCKAAKHLK